jgi:hypothetical protein
MNRRGFVTALAGAIVAPKAAELVERSGFMMHGDLATDVGILHERYLRPAMIAVAEQIEVHIMNTYDFNSSTYRMDVLAGVGARKLSIAQHVRISDLFKDSERQALELNAEYDLEFV